MGCHFLLQCMKVKSESEVAQSCPTLCDPVDGSPPGSPVPGKNTGVGCHFLLQCMKVKSESEVAQSCLTLSNPMDCSLPGSSVHGIFQVRVLEWGAILTALGHTKRACYDEPVLHNNGKAYIRGITSHRDLIMILINICVFQHQFFITL